MNFQTAKSLFADEQGGSLKSKHDMKSKILAYSGFMCYQKDGFYPQTFNSSQLPETLL